MKFSPFLLCACLCLLLPPSAVASDLPPRLSFSLTAKNRYIWRGVDYYGDNRPVLMPSLTWNVGKTGLNVTVFGAMALEDRNDLMSREELDLFLAWRFWLSKDSGWWLDLGGANYGFYHRPQYSFSTHNSQEWRISTGVEGPRWQTELHLYFDRDAKRDSYLQGRVDRLLLERGATSLSARGELTWDGGQNRSRSGWGYGALGIKGVTRTNWGGLMAELTWIHIFSREINPSRTEWMLALGLLL